MARLEPQQNLINLKEKFSQKNSSVEFKKLYENLRQEMKNYSLQEKRKGGEYENMIYELSTLNHIIDKYNILHIEYTGGSNATKDGILYFENKKQEVEIVSMVDEQAKKTFRNSNSYSQIEVRASIKETMQKFPNLKEEQAKNFLESWGITESFLYEKIVYVLNKKNKGKYKDFWLLIAYTPWFCMNKFNKEETRNFVLKKIQSQEGNLISSIQKIFKKIVFVPLNIELVRTEQENHQIFEWKV